MTPTAPSPATTRLAEPLRIGPAMLRNRIVGAPMERNYCDGDGHLTPLYIDYVAARAAGGAALVYTESSYVRQDGKARPHQMGLCKDSQTVGLRALADRVHAAGALLGMELNHGGRNAKSTVSGLPNVAPSPVRLPLPGAEAPIELTPADIQDLVECFAAAARRCREAGVDVIAVHAAHGYLIHEFMSPAVNHRDDAYRAPTRFLAEVLHAVRAEAPGLAVGIRISAFEGSPGGLSAEAQLALIEELGTAELDFIDVSVGNYETPEWMIQPGEFPRGFLAEYAAPYRRLGIPVGVAGRINDPAVAEDILARGQADYVMMARALHADPGFPGHALDGTPFRPCIACNLCADELGAGPPIRCSVNVRVHQAGRELAAPPARRHGRVLVVGAGPAGLEAACVLAEAGVEVRLLDANAEIGGQFHLPSRLVGVPEYHRLLEWYRGRLERDGVELGLTTIASAAETAEGDYDGVIVAAGALDAAAAWPGHERAQGIRSWLAQRPPTPRRAVIIGGDREAVAVGYDLARAGARVEIIAEQSALGLDMGRRAKLLPLAHLASNPEVTIHLETRVERLTADAVEAVGPEGPIRVPSDEVVLTTLGVRRRLDLLEELGRQAPGRSIVLDAGGPNETVLEAITAGREAAEQLLGRLPA